MTFRQFGEIASERFLNKPNERLGQAYFNTLAEVRPDLAEKIRGKIDLDPYYQDTQLTAFLSYLSEVWDYARMREEETR